MLSVVLHVPRQVSRALSGRIGLALAVLAGLWCWDAILFRRSWSGWMPAGLAVIFAIVTMRRRDGSGAQGRRTAVLALALALVVVALFHSTFVRAAGDGRDYFAQLHSFVIDLDVDFTNETADFGTPDPAGLPIGSAILWIPFYVAAHVWIWILHLLGGNVEPDGYRAPYQMAVGLGTVAYGLAGLALAYRVARGFFSAAIALGSVVAVASGSFLIWYLTIDASWSHGTSMFAVTLFLYVWHMSRSSRTPLKWALLGAAAGLMTLVRWQNLMFVLAPALETSILVSQIVARRELARLGTLGRGVLAATATGLVVFLPQMYVWKVTYGGWLTTPHAQSGQMWWRDSLLVDVLFSSNHGLFTWHPLLYVATLGMLLFARRDWKLATALGACFFVQAYLNGAISTWWGGSAFGGRRFDGMILLFVLGLAAAIEAGLRRPGLLVSAVTAGFVAANALLFAGIRNGDLPMGNGVTADRFATLVYSRIGNPFAFPSNAWFAWRYGGTPADYDRLGRQLFSNIHVEIGEPGDEQFLTRGWSGPETDNEGSFRRSSGTSSGVWMSLLGARALAPGQPAAMPDYRLTFRAAPLDPTGANPQRLTVEINLTEVAAFEMANGFQEYEVIVPGVRLGRSLNTVHFRLRDARGAKFDWLSFRQGTGR